MINLALADLEGACSAHAPGSRFFRFDIQNFGNRTASGVHAPPYKVHASYGKSWIRHWHCLVRESWQHNTRASNRPLQQWQMRIILRALLGDSCLPESFISVYGQVSQTRYIKIWIHQKFYLLWFSSFTMNLIQNVDSSLLNTLEDLNTVDSVIHPVWCSNLWCLKTAPLLLYLGILCNSTANSHTWKTCEV